MSSLRFTEEMDGHLLSDPAESDHERGRRRGEQAGTAVMFHLTIEVDDTAAFHADPAHRASARGWVKLGGEAFAVTAGEFNLFPDTDHPRKREMRYRLPFTGADGRAMVLSGEKHVQDEEGFDVWRDTTTLLTELRDEATGERVAIGILRLTAGDFLRQLTTVGWDGTSAPLAFGSFFAKNLWQAYGAQRLPDTPKRRAPAPRTSPIPLREEIVPYTTEDDFTGHLVRVRHADREPDLGPVYMAAGSSVRTNIFRAPIEINIVEALVDAGYDVWLNEWRASFEHARNAWSLDEGALYDHPEGVRTVVRVTGAEKIKALVHCQGSSSFFMGLVSGKMPQVDTVVCNAMALHPVVHPLSKAKIVGLTPLMGLVADYVDISWGIRPQNWLSHLIRSWVRATNRECDNLVCRISSFFYGYSRSAMWDHAKLSRETHDWLTDEFEWIPIRFFRQMRRSILRGHLVWDRKRDGVPRDLCAQPPQTDARITFLQGTSNRCFSPESQARSFAWFDRHQPGRHQLREMRGYGHFDCWMGDDAPRDVFPIVLDALADEPVPGVNIVPSAVTPVA